MAEKRIVIVRETTRDRIERNLATIFIAEFQPWLQHGRPLVPADMRDIARRTVNEWLKDYRVERRK